MFQPITYQRVLFYFQLPIILLLLFILGIPPCIGQTRDSISYTSIEQALEDHDIEEAQILLKAIKAQIGNQPSTSDQIELEILQSKLAFKKGEYALAKELIVETNQTYFNFATPIQQVKLLAWLGYNYVEWLTLTKADSVLETAIAIYKDQHLNHPPVRNYLDYSLGLFRIAQHEYEQADSIFLNLLSDTLLKKNQLALYFETVTHFGESKMEQKKWMLADSILSKNLEDIMLLKGNTHFFNVSVLNNLGRLYDDMGRDEEGVVIFQKALEISKVYVSNIHPIYGRILTNLGRLFIKIGEYSKAEELLLQVKDIYFHQFGETARYGYMLSNLDNLYDKLGQTDKQLFYQLKQKEIFSNSSRYTDYARIVNNLSYSYQDLKQLEEANQLLKEGILFLRDNKQTDFGLYAILLMNYAGLNIDMGNFSIAEKAFKESKEVILKVYNNLHPWYAAIINNLASLYQDTGKYEEAKALYVETEVIDKQTVGVMHPYYIGTTYKLANIYNLTKNDSIARAYYQRANEGQINLIYNYYSGFDEETRLDYLKTTEEKFHRFYSFAYDQGQTNATICKEVQSISLAIKNLALDFSANNQSLANEIKDTTLSGIFKNYLAAKKLLAKNYIQTEEDLTKKGIDVKALEEQVELLEKQLVRSEVLSTTRLADQQRLKYEDITANLSKEEAVIDVFHFPYYTADRKTDSTFYVALVNRRELDAPKMVLLGEEKQLYKMLRPSIRANGGNYIANQKIGQDVYEQIWKPLTPYLAGIKHIAISPSGLLHKVAFGALPYEADQYLNDKYRFTYHGNLRAKINAKETTNLDKSIALMGGANFDLDSLELTILAQELSKESIETISLPSQDLASTDVILTADTSLRSAIIFNYLPGTKEEVQQIAQQFKTNKWKVHSFIGDALLEENFKSQSGKAAPSVLHIATHGYFFGPLKKGKKVSDNARGRIMAAKNPLLRSGLALSGANYAWKLGKQIPDIEDGILTAYEIANQNLGNTDLVVLSACETGRGDVVNGEGVFGLQRAFKMAGAKKMITSLWKVPDQQTTELMILFYKYYLTSSDAADALHQAQLAMRAQYPPFYWASFVLIE